MEWRGRRGSQNIEDRRGAPGRGGMARVGGAGGLGVVAIVLIGMFFGVDLTPLLQDQGGDGGFAQGSAEITEADQERAQFVSVALADTEEVWAELFRREAGRDYPAPVLVLFKGGTGSPCGGASGATGPFYCPADRKVYLDTDFFVTMERQLGARGDFAAAYVVAHEVAHHVQNALGVLPQVNERRRQVSETESNALSVRVELQADCLAGLWAARAEERFGSLNPGDIEEAIAAARQIGDDTLQKAAGRRPMPHTFTHGTSAQRARWFTTGYRADGIAACDTFSTDRL
jgi:hypothetical protein